ncbi:MAG TPA: hypothetical protein VFZ32_15150 [Micromonosporaceae bacterium]
MNRLIGVLKRSWKRLLVIGYLLPMLAAALVSVELFRGVMS